MSFKITIRGQECNNSFLMKKDNVLSTTDDSEVEPGKERNIKWIAAYRVTLARIHTEGVSHTVSCTWWYK